MTMCDARAFPATVQVESIVIVSPDLCTSRLVQSRCELPTERACIIWSVEESTHCRITWVGTLPFPKLVFTSHRPGLRDGNSAADAIVGKKASTRSEVVA